MPAPHPPEFRRRAVELARLREKPIAAIAKDLGISESCLRNWMSQSEVDEAAVKGCPGMTARSWSDCAVRTGSRRWRSRS